MPIQFRCHACDRRLSIGSHKAGTQVRCPKCHAAVSVPTPDQLAAISAMSGSPPVENEPAEPVDLSELAFEDQSTEQARAASPRPAPEVPIDPNLISISRAVLYAQAVLIAVVGLVAFVLGYVIGSVSAPEGPDGKGGKQSTEPVVARGRLTYRSSDGASTNDAGAVILVIPQAGAPDERIAVDGLRPQDPAPDDNHRSLRAIQSLGGAYARADGAGRFTIVIAKPGRYHVLRISKSSRRAAGDPPRSADLAVIGSYFLPASELIGAQRYSLEQIAIRPGVDLAYEFGSGD